MRINFGAEFLCRFIVNFLINATEVKMARRGENIFLRKDGRWEARVLERHGNGDKSYRSLYGKSYTEAKAKKEEYYSKAHRAAVPAAKKLASFRYLAESWLAFIKGTVKESTYTRYHRNVYGYLVPAIGKHTVSGIDSRLLTQIKDEMLTCGGKRGKGLSEKTVSDIFSTLKIILLHASEHGYPVIDIALIRSPRRKKREIATIPDEAIRRMEDALLRSDEAICLGILLTLHTGIRNRELCGLRWDDFNFQASTVRIRRTVERIADLDPLSNRRTKVVVSEPKTDASRRVIPLPKALCRYLRAHCGSEGSYLLTGTNKPSEPHTLYVRYERYLKQNGFERYSFHALRHTFATRGIESGFDAKSLSEILGHSDVTTRLRCYVHPSMEQKRRQMEVLFGAGIRGQKYGI